MTEHSDVEPLPVADWDPSLSDIVDDMQGAPFNVHRLMANHPDLLKAWWSFRNYGVNGGELGRRKGELVKLRVAINLRAWYEWASHVDRSLGCGLTREEIERVKLGAKAPGWEPGEALLLQAVDELIADHAITPATHAQLREHYSVKQIIDIMAIHDMYVILGCMINTWELEVDARVLDNLPDDVTKENFKTEFPR